MSQAELVYQHLKQLPESIVAEVLDFVLFLERKRQASGLRQPRQPGSPWPCLDRRRLQYTVF